MKILVTGANGFVGAALCASVLKSGHSLRKVIRHSGEQNTTSQIGLKKESAESEVAFVQSIGCETEWQQALDSVDVVIHLAARVHVMSNHADDPLEEFRKVNAAGTERLARMAVAHGVKRFVYVSSIKVNGEETFPVRYSLSPASSQMGDKSTIFSEADIPTPQDPYGASKWEAEQILHYISRETGLEVVIVRPPLVYGAGVKGNFVQMLKVLNRGIPLPLASVENRRSLIYVENLADALILCATHPIAAGQTYLVSDGEDISTPELLRKLGVAMGHPARLFPCPPTLLKFSGRLFGKTGQVERLLGSLQVDSRKIRRELGWQPSFTLQQGLQATAEWYRNSHL